MNRKAGEIFISQRKNTPEEQQLIDQRMKIDEQEALDELLNRPGPTNIYEMPTNDGNKYYTPGREPVMAQLAPTHVRPYLMDDDETFAAEMGVPNTDSLQYDIEMIKRANPEAFIPGYAN